MWDRATQNVEGFWPQMQTRIIRKLSRKGWEFNEIVLSCPDGFYRVEDEDDFVDFVDIAIDNGLTKIHLRVVAPALLATVVQVCHHTTTQCTSMHPIYVTYITQSPLHVACSTFMFTLMFLSVRVLVFVNISIMQSTHHLRARSTAARATKGRWPRWPTSYHWWCRLKAPTSQPCPPRPLHLQHFHPRRVGRQVIRV